jgi:hypothetical protein
MLEYIHLHHLVNDEHDRLQRQKKSEYPVSARSVTRELMNIPENEEDEEEFRA